MNKQVCTLKQYQHFFKMAMFINILPPYNFETRKEKYVSKIFFFNFTFTILTSAILYAIVCPHFFDAFKHSSNKTLFLVIFIECFTVLNVLNIFLEHFQQKRNICIYFNHLQEIDQLLKLRNGKIIHVWIELVVILVLCFCSMAIVFYSWRQTKHLIMLNVVYSLYYLRILIATFLIIINANLINGRFNVINLKLVHLEEVRTKSDIFNINVVLESLHNLVIVVDLFNKIFGRQLLLILALNLTSIIGTVDFFLEADLIIGIQSKYAVWTAITQLLLHMVKM